MTLCLRLLSAQTCPLELTSYLLALAAPLLSTFAHFAKPNHTIVLVVIELRQADVIQEFLELWLKEGEGRWEIRRLVGNDDDPVGSGWGAGEGRFAGWIGWRTR